MVGQAIVVGAQVWSASRGKAGYDYRQEQVDYEVGRSVRGGRLKTLTGT